MGGMTWDAWAEEATRWGVDPSRFSSVATLREAVLKVARGSMVRGH